MGRPGREFAETEIRALNPITGARISEPQQAPDPKAVPLVLSTICLAKLLRVADPRSVRLMGRENLQQLDAHRSHEPENPLPHWGLSVTHKFGLKARARMWVTDRPGERWSASVPGKAVLKTPLSQPG